MKNIVIIYGGRSVEHDVSILTALHAVKHIEGHRVHLVYLTRDNIMVTGEALNDIDFYIGDKNKAAKCMFVGNILYAKGLFWKKICKVDAVLNCCHGGIGEDGTLAAFFAALGLPVTSCNHAAASLAQSKSATREKLTSAGFLQPKFVTIKKSEFESNKSKTISSISKLPVIIKPDTLGSSIGITLAKTFDEVAAGLALAFTMNNVAIVEQYLENIQEINCSAFKAQGKIWTSQCELIKNDKQVFDFDTKYLDSSSGFTKKAARDSDEDKEYKQIFKKIQKMTAKIYELFGCSGVVRADFILCAGKLYLCEINTIPGFLSYHLWARTHMPYGLLINMLIEQAIIENKVEYLAEFKSDVLEKNRSLVN